KNAMTLERSKRKDIKRKFGLLMLVYRINLNAYNISNFCHTDLRLRPSLILITLLIAKDVKLPK
ncbi:hypothetical protein L9F63_014893, partial [Diploptera punctata]